MSFSQSLTSVSSALLCLLVLGCDWSSAGNGSGGSKSPAPGQGIEYTFDSLDVSTVDEQSSSWCVPPAFTPAGFSELDRETFANVLADYTSGWMTPLHESLLGLNEASVFDSIFETVLASHDTSCDSTDDEDWEFLPPDDELVDPGNQRATRDDVIEAILSAEEIESGATLRLALRGCDGCSEGLAQHPLFITARITTDGVLTAELRLDENQTWVQTLYVTPDAAVVQAPLGPYLTWVRDVEAATGSTVELPNVQGTLTAIVRKDNAGGTSATIGVESLAFDARPGESESVWGDASGDCIGFHVALSGSSNEAQLAANFGNFELTVPGSINCDTSECGDAERQENWTYSLGGVAVTVEQPSPGESDNLKVGVVAERASTARVGAREFARGGLGKVGQGGHLGVGVDKTSSGFMVSFQPALTMGGAMTISSFSDHLQMNLPDWLSDEIFDLTFGGEPKAQIFVPARRTCSADSFEGPPPARRSLVIESGTLSAVTPAGDRVAGPGTCIGSTLAPESSLLRTSDWVDVGFVCE